MEIGVANYFEANAMMHLHRIANMIDRHRSMLDKEELFYETGSHTVVSVLDEARKQKLLRMRRVRMHANTPGLFFPIEND